MTALRDTSFAEQPQPPLRDRAEAEAYVASVCFKHGPPRLLGVELEWTVHHADDPCRSLDAEHLADALGPHAPQTLRRDSPNLPLPHGSPVTVEPGGQVEISPPPQRTLPGLLATVSADIAHLTALLDAAGLELGRRGVDAHRPPRRLLDVPRYAAMEAAFNRLGSDGITMMCSTAGLQVCLDAGEADRVAPRWAAVHALGPVMSAAFANSPDLGGQPTSWASARMRALHGTDPPRTKPGAVTDTPAAAWARRVLDTPLICVRRPGPCWDAPAGVSFADWIAGALPRPPTADDLDYHLTTMFTPVRPRGYLEVRYLDTQPPGEWIPPVVLLVALFSSESTVDAVLEATESAVGRWVQAAHEGLADPRLRLAARRVLDLAHGVLDRTDLPPELLEDVSTQLDRRLTGSLS